MTLSFLRNCSPIETRPVDRILFYRTNEPYGEFSNFSAHPIRLKGVICPTTEHYFQAQKFIGTPHEEDIRKLESPMLAARAGRSRKRPLNPNRETIKEEVMRDALRAKFSQHTELAELLLSIGDAELVEHSANDHYWADGGNGTGRNRLGQLLMELRAELRARE